MPEQAAPERPRTDREALCLDLYFWLQSLTFALVVLILVFTLLGRVIGVEGTSMDPTLRDGDVLLLQSMGFEPRQGDVVVLTKEFGPVRGPIVKRVVAVGGQQVDIDYASGTVRVDGAVLEEPYLEERMERPPDPNASVTSVKVPEGHVFVMGDNRNHSSDSRDVRLGTVDERYILGKARLVLLPLKSFGVIR